MGRRRTALWNPLKYLSGALPLGAMDADVEGAHREEPFGIGLSGTPGHHGPGQDQGLQRPPGVVAAAGGVRGLSRCFQTSGVRNWRIEPESDSARRACCRALLADARDDGVEHGAAMGPSLW